MSYGKKYLLCQLTLILLMLIYGSSVLAASQPIALGGCQDLCGNVQIPYPFGIGKRCYWSEWFRIVCNMTSNGTSIPFLAKLGMEVINISLQANVSTIRIENHLVFVSDCYGSTRDGALSQTLNLTGSPFYSSPLTSLVAVGCNAWVLLKESHSIVQGCQSNCNISTVTKENIVSDTTKCNGYRCCRAPVDYRQDFDLKIQKTGGNSNTIESQDKCNYAFLTDKIWSPSTVPKLELLRKGSMSLTLNWYVDGSMKLDNYSVKCANTSLSNANGTYEYCWCADGYRGNPYLPDGCQDINECQESEAEGWKICGKNTCENTPGAYHCEVKKVWPLIFGFSLAFGLLLLAAGVWRLTIFVRRQKEIRLKRRFFRQNGGLLLQQQLSSSDGKVEQVRVFSSKELEKATDGFSEGRILGQGGQGTVFKGMLVGGSIVAVKKSNLVDTDKVEEFINEIIILSQINHRNIVKLLGCCLEAEVPIMVYEFIPNGNLFQHLHHPSDEFPLTWEVRLRIAAEIASALCYLHSAAAIPIYHRDIKSTNILLDEKYRAKVSDFGISRSITIDQTHLTTKVQGTFGYLDPEYFRSSQFTEKSDVYSFGVVLVELLTGEKPAILIGSDDYKHLASDFNLAMKENRLFDILDARIIEQCNPEEVTQVAHLARKCLSSKGKRRPTMKEVAMELERIQSPQTGSDFRMQNDEEIVQYVKIDVEDPGGVLTAPAFHGGSSSPPSAPYETW